MAEASVPATPASDEPAPPRGKVAAFLLWSGLGVVALAVLSLPVSTSAQGWFGLTTIVVFVAWFIAIFAAFLPVALIVGVGAAAGGKAGAGIGGLLALVLVPALLGAGTLLGGQRGWRIAVVAGSAVVLSTILLIARIVASAAFLAGVYGAFGKAAATFALVMLALVIELVALLPIVQVKYLMTRMGRRALGLPER